MPSKSLFSIAEIERTTGISRDILRVWERRYGFPTPIRNPRGERLYDDKQLSRLRLFKQLLDSGMRPGKLMHLDDQQLRDLTLQPQGTVATPAGGNDLLELLAGGLSSDLRPRLEALLLQHGLSNFISDVVGPTNQAVGEAWFAGRIGIADEHHYAEQLNRVLTTALASLPRGKGSPRVLLTTLPGEEHGLGLLMVACMLCLEGAEVLSLGVQTPPEEIVRGAVQGGFGIVALSCTEYPGRRTLISQLTRLRSMLPAGISLWAGGCGVRTIRFLPDNIRLFTDLRQIPAALQSGAQQGSPGASNQEKTKEIAP